MDAHLDTSRVRKVKRYGNASIDEFLENVDDLTKAIKDIEAPEIARVRAKVKMALASAKSALSDSAAQVRGRARLITQATDTYVHDNPWQVVGVAAAVGIAVGILLTRRSD
jgi:ElaB/YqjD/DUF883 family membrane-anchored ribosome-binding protein